MLIALVVGFTLAGLFAGITIHQRKELMQAKDLISDLNQDVVHLTDKNAELRAETKAHETSIAMIMEEVLRANDTSA